MGVSLRKYICFCSVSLVSDKTLNIPKLISCGEEVKSAQKNDSRQVVCSFIYIRLYTLVFYVFICSVREYLEKRNIKTMYYYI